MKRIVRWIEAGLTGAMSIALVGLMGVVTMDVVGRNVFDSPLIWAGEIVEILVALSIVFAFPLLALRQGHIVVELLTFRGVTERVIRVGTAVLCAAMFLLVGYVLFRHGGNLKSWGENTMVMRLPLWIFAMALAVLFLTSALAFLTPKRWITDAPNEGEV